MRNSGIEAVLSPCSGLILFNWITQKYLVWREKIMKNYFVQLIIWLVKMIISHKKCKDYSWRRKAFSNQEQEIWPTIKNELVIKNQGKVNQTNNGQQEPKLKQLFAKDWQDLKKNWIHLSALNKRRNRHLELLLPIRIPQS